jgi:protein-tyrosine phosphatase
VTTLIWEGCVNVRDVGGLPTADGGTTRLGAIVRADNIRKLSDSGWRSVWDYGVRRVVDLRFPEELAEDPPCDVPVEIVHISLLGDSRTEEWEAEFNSAVDAAPDAESYLVWAYGEWLARYRAAFGRALGAVATAPPGAVLVHCLGGKDRTGLVVALALRVAGVGVEEIAADYALTEANLAGIHDAWVAAAPDALERRRRELLLPSPAPAMREVLERLEHEHGSTDRYLLGCGLSSSELRTLRDRLRMRL